MSALMAPFSSSPDRDTSHQTNQVRYLSEGANPTGGLTPMRTLSLILLTVVSLAARPDDDLAPDFTLAELSGKTVTLSTLKGKKAIVLVFAGIECPRSTSAETRLGDMAKKYGTQDVAFYVINSNWSETVEA